MPILNNKLCTSIALIFLLAACGGGGGTEKAVSATPDSLATENKPANDVAELAGNAPAGDSPGSTPAAGDGHAVLATAPVSADGISGEVLSAMLDTRTPDLDLLAGGSTFASPSTGRYGPRIEGSDGPFISSSQQLEPSNYVPLPAGTAFNPYISDRYAPAKGGSLYHASHFVQNRWYISDDALAQFSRLEISTGIASSEHSVSIGEVLNLETGDAKAPHAITLNAAQRVNIPRQGLLRYGEVIQQWNNGLSRVRLLLQKGQQANQAELCWHVQLPGMLRLVCNGWEVPDNWRSGMPLKLESYYIEDDRSVRTGEAGYLYWRG